MITSSNEPSTMKATEDNPESSRNVKIKRVVAKEILIALSITAIIAITVFILKLYTDSQESHIDRQYPNNYDSLGISEQEEYNKVKWALNKPFYDNQKWAEDFCAKIIYSILVFVYPIRILYYLIKWCIATLKT